MNDDQVCFEYHRLLLDDRVPPLFDCLNRDQMMHPFFNTETSEIYYQCLSCDYKMIPGINMIRKMRKAVYNAYDEEQLSG